MRLEVSAGGGTWRRGARRGGFGAPSSRQPAIPRRSWSPRLLDPPCARKKPRDDSSADGRLLQACRRDLCSLGEGPQRGRTIGRGCWMNATNIVERVPIHADADAVVRVAGTRVTSPRTKTSTATSSGGCSAVTPRSMSSAFRTSASPAQTPPVLKKAAAEQRVLITHDTSPMALSRASAIGVCQE